jgi:hypothetical protein
MLYRDLFRELDQQQVEYLLVGGLAMVLHGVPRLTMDVDLVVALRPDNLERLIRAARTLSLTPSVPVQIEELADPAKRAAWMREKGMLAFPLRSPEASSPTIDVLIGARLDFDAAYSRRVKADLEGTPIWVAAVEDIIAMKQETGRAQDQADIALLRKLQGAS